MKEQKNPNFKLWELINLSSRAINKVRQQELDRYGTTLSQSAILRVALDLGEEATPTEISRRLFLELNSISEQLRRMETEGLIEKVKDLKRKNLIRILVTKEGHELYRQTTNQKAIEYVMSILTEEEKTALRTILSKLQDRAVKRLSIKK